MIQPSVKLTENETIKLLVVHLEKEGWYIESYCLGSTRGCDIVASRENKKMYVEVKGSRADDAAPNKKRPYFDSGQIKSHFGVALVKALDTKHLYPMASIAIAHPDDDSIRKAIGHLIPFLKPVGVLHLWVTPEGRVTVD